MSLKVWGHYGYFIVICVVSFLQYTNWEEISDGLLNQKMIADIVGDYFFICPSNHFAEVMSAAGLRVYYYFFTHVSTKVILLK